MPRLLFPIAVAALLCMGSRESAAQAPEPAAPEAKKAPAAGKETPRAALILPGRALATRLGPHRLTCQARTSSAVTGYASREVVQQMTWRVDADGAFHARKNTHEQYGQEVILTGGWLYPRLRHSKFVRRKPREGEAARILDRMASYLPDYLGLLRRFVEVTSAGKATYEGRPALKVKLSLKETPLPAPESAASPARRWRSDLVVTALSGVVLLDAQTRVPLSAQLKARLTFKAPRPGKKAPASGIPSVVSDKLKGTMTLSLTQRVDRLGKVSAITPPAEEETISDVRRRRLELERQLFSGERSIPDDWRPEP